MTAYGAFVELEEGIDGMVHVSDMSWTRKINHPSEMLKKGDEVEAEVIDIDGSTGSPRARMRKRISLGLKQLEDDPWKAIESRYKIGDLVKARSRRSRASAPSWSWKATSTGSSTSRRSARTGSTRSRTT
jgi:small subunit ribosomal protein S1